MLLHSLERRKNNRDLAVAQLAEFLPTEENGIPPATSTYVAAGYSVTNSASAAASGSRMLGDAKISARIAEIQAAAHRSTT